MIFIRKLIRCSLLIGFCYIFVCVCKSLSLLEIINKDWITWLEIENMLFIYLGILVVFYIFFIYLLIFHQFPQISYFELFYGVFFFRYTILILLPYDRGQYHCNISVNACPYILRQPHLKDTITGSAELHWLVPFVKM